MEEQSPGQPNSEKMPLIDTVLIVDDEDNWQFVIKRMLQKEGIGQRIITANNGLEALQQLQALAAAGEKLPALIFLDLKMPVMDGIEFLEEITKSTDLNLSQTRIFVLTSSLLAIDKERANSYPISAFISKPLTPEILKELLF